VHRIVEPVSAMVRGDHLTGAHDTDLCLTWGSSDDRLGKFFHDAVWYTHRRQD